MSENERDPRVEAAWSAASREEPPSAVDAAVRAAARRAVDAGPARKRNKHWWYPLASAAMVAVLAVTIVQLTPPEQVAPTIVADSTVAPRAAPEEIAPSALSKEEVVTARLAEKSAAPPPGAAPVPIPQQIPAGRAQSAATGTLARQRAEAPPDEGNANKQLLAAKRELDAQDKLASVKRDVGTSNAASPSPDAARSPASVAPAPPESAAVASARSEGERMSEPFPAARAPEPRRDQYADERKPAVNAAARLEPRREVPGDVLPEGERSAAPREVTPSAAPPSAQEPMKSRVLAAKITAHDEARAKDASGRSVEEWIKRIRDLKREGRVDEAAKELAAFRTAYGERADALLPADLREK
jgi:hypothetical protein